MKVKDAIKQLSEMYQEAELVIELDDFPNYYSPVMGFKSDKAGEIDESSKGCFNSNILKHCGKRTDLENVRSVVICK